VAEISQIKCSLNLPLEPLKVEMDQGLIQSVFDNIILNAAAAMPFGGSLDIVVKVTPLSERFSFSESSFDIIVSNTGKGIPPYRSSGVSPVLRAMRAIILGPISSPS